jgi:AbrB family looped-hinge helix DNA binding protein
LITLIQAHAGRSNVSKIKGKKCCAARGYGKVSHHIEAIITIDERGQMVLPKETRTKAGIRAGDKLALVGWRRGDHVCCLSLVKVEEMTEMLGDLMDSLTTAVPASDV